MSSMIVKRVCAYEPLLPSLTFPLNPPPKEKEPISQIKKKVHPGSTCIKFDTRPALLRNENIKMCKQQITSKQTKKESI